MEKCGWRGGKKANLKVHYPRIPELIQCSASLHSISKCTLETKQKAESLEAKAQGYYETQKHYTTHCLKINKNVSFEGQGCHTDARKGMSH